MMKKLKMLPLLIALVMLFSAFAGCSSSTVTPSVTAQETAAPTQSAAVSETPAASSTPAETQAQATDYKSVSINIGTLKGPSAMGMVQLMQKSDAGEAANDYNFTLSTAPTDIVAKVISGELDIAAVPSNTSATLYAKTQGGVQVITVSTLGVLYILENGNTISSVSDLKGKTIAASGQGANPEYVLNYILRKNGLEPGTDVTVNYYPSHEECATAIASGVADIALLPEPNVTAVMTKNTSLRIALDLTDEWNKVTSDGVLTMTSVIASSEFIKENPAAVDKFLEEYKASIDFVNNNVSDAAALIEQYEILASAAIAEKAIPNCNIVFIAGADIKPALEGFLKVMYDADPNSVGGALPDDNFYYIGDQS